MKFFQDFKQQFLTQDVSMESEGSCKCTHCLQLATANFLAAHTNKTQNSLASFNPIDPSDPNIHPSFYNTMQVNCLFVTLMIYLPYRSVIKDCFCSFVCSSYLYDVICFASVYDTNAKYDTSCNLQSDWATTTGRSLVMGV